MLVTKSQAFITIIGPGALWKALLANPVGIRHHKYALHVKLGRENAIKHFPHVRHAPSKSNPSIHRMEGRVGIALLNVSVRLTTCENRRNLTCDYSRSQNRNGATDPLPYVLPVNDDQADVQRIDFPTILFLDPGLLQHGQIEISQITTPVPAHIIHLLGDLDEIRRTAATFFEYIHLWMPFVSKKRFYELYLRPSFRSRPDVALLLVCFKLVTTLPPKRPRNPRSPLYHAAKHFYLEVEGSSAFSVPVLQAGMLLCLYELGHAIYPSAFLSIGACARYAHALGINGGKTPKTRKVLTLVEVEERRRIWWAIVILDRSVPYPFTTYYPSTCYF